VHHERSLLHPPTGRDHPEAVADAQSYSQATPSYGFGGDPLRPVSGKYYGYLARAALY
jgi:hypothetical protein